MKTTRVDDAARRVRTRLEESYHSLADTMLAHRAVLATELAALDLAIEALGYALHNRQPKPPAPANRGPRKVAKKRAKKVTRKALAKKAKKQPAKKAATKRSAPIVADAPDVAVRIGRLPTKVRVEAMPNEDERLRRQQKLIDQGFRRASPSERLAPGLYDVIRRDGGIVLTWWPKEVK